MVFFCVTNSTNHTHTSQRSSQRWKGVICPYGTSVLSSQYCMPHVAPRTIPMGRSTRADAPHPAAVTNEAECTTFGDFVRACVIVMLE